MGNHRPSRACTAWLVAAVVTPVAGLFAPPLALAAAVLVLFAFVIAAIASPGSAGARSTAEGSAESIETHPPA